LLLSSSQLSWLLQPPGLHCIILTMGELGAAILTLKPHQQQHQQQRRPPQHQDVVLQAQHIPAQRVGSVVNLCGAGDTLVGGFAAARMRDCSPLQALAVGVCAAALSVQSKANVPGPGEGLTFDAVRAAAQPLLDQQHAWEFVVPPGLARL
jgi:sugar/nucleoside kinase (ribokinase family)